MDNKITFYKLNGEISSEELLNENSLEHINGMMVKCYMKNGLEAIGFADSYRIHDKDFGNLVHDYIYLYTWDNLDEDKHELIGDDDLKYNQTFKKVNIEDIVRIEAILHSNPRWGGKITNSFNYFVSHFTSNNNK